ncbi:uncharacterized protein LOC133522848 [Cydia pomonella]|uniref:uncharacterized protein LOC133522848 n=1 Tax=Cydia pomonella TaxID=82600 RepID=UPI002ADE3441|nr:uncharacterized protein LOC133522848 [Cydia pomonella]
MGFSSTTVLLLAIASQVFTAPQFITFKEGKVGVNFGGYHAAAGLGGVLGNGGAGGLFAEAGTPHGQAAAAGLGGGAGGGGSGGGLYAGATAGGNVKAAAGLAGGADVEKSGGIGFAGASAGNRNAAAGLGGESGATGSSGFTYSSSKSFGVSSGAVEQPISHVDKKVHTEFDFNAASPVVPLTNTVVKSKTKVKEVRVEQPPPVVVEKHFVQPQPVVVEKHVYHEQPVIVEKHIYHKKPHRFHNKVSVHGYIGGAGALPPPPPIEKRIDVGVENYASAGADAAVAHGGNQQVSYTKQVNFQRNPQFFADIFNIPISTLKAVGNFLGNTAGSTSVSVQKSASVQAGAESPKHDGLSSDSSKQTQVSIQTPDASKLIDDIFAIPINTLGAVNKFLENNVPARKKVQISSEGVEEPARFRGGRHARRRVNKTVTIEQPQTNTADEIKEE